MQYPDASVCAARRNYFRRHTQISELVHVFICTFYRNLTPYRLQLAKQENRNKYLNNTLILFVNNIYSAGYIRSFQIHCHTDETMYFCIIS